MCTALMPPLPYRDILLRARVPGEWIMLKCFCQGSSCERGRNKIIIFPHNHKLWGHPPIPIRRRCSRMVKCSEWEELTIDNRNIFYFKFIVDNFPIFPQKFAYWIFIIVASYSPSHLICTRMNDDVRSWLGKEIFLIVETDIVHTRKRISSLAIYLTLAKHHHPDETLTVPYMRFDNKRTWISSVNKMNYIKRQRTTTVATNYV